MSDIQFNFGALSAALISFILGICSFLVAKKLLAAIAISMLMRIALIFGSILFIILTIAFVIAFLIVIYAIYLNFTGRL